MLRLALALGLLASPALAGDYIAFHSPSGNIQCAIFTGDGWDNVRCDLSNLTPSYRKQPADCEFDWGSSFAVDLTGKGYLACVSDAVADQNGVELGYGKSISLGGFTCTSQKSGMTCTNPGGHGFAIAKARQRVF